MRLSLTLLALLIAALCTVRPAWAHAAPHSVVLLDLRTRDVGAELRLPVTELEAALGTKLSPAPAPLTDNERESIRALVARDLAALSPNEARWRLEVGSIGRSADDQGSVVVVNGVLAPPEGGSVASFRLIEGVIGNEVPNHNAWVAVRSDFARGLVDGPPQVAGVTHYGRHTVRIERQGGGALQGLRAIFRLGVRHIAEGTDHLLFLLVLLLPAPLALAPITRRRKVWGEHADVRASLVNLLRVVTAFTVGHSLTLLLGALGWVHLPGAPVETLIAVSILVSAIHAIRPIFPGREAWVSGGFGLVHGLAFASALAELHLDAPRLSLALLGFNLGIEAMQLVVIAVSFPWLLVLARTRLYTPFRITGAALAGAASVGWTAERAFGFRNPMNAVITNLAAHPLVLIVALAALALTGRIIGRDGRPVFTTESSKRAAIVE